MQFIAPITEVGEIVIIGTSELNTPRKVVDQVGAERPLVDALPSRHQVHPVEMGEDERARLVDDADDRPAAPSQLLHHGHALGASRTIEPPICSIITTSL